MEDHGINNDIINLKCLIHQKALCAKLSTLESVRGIVVKAVNFILFRGLISTIFTNSGSYGDLLYFCNVRWLSRDEMLRRVHTLREKIAIFLKKTQMPLNFAIKNGFLI